jgi:hypothetical protein
LFNIDNNLKYQYQTRTLPNEEEIQQRRITGGKETEKIKQSDCNKGVAGEEKD